MSDIIVTETIGDDEQKKGVWCVVAVHGDSAAVVQNRGGNEVGTHGCSMPKTQVPFASRFAPPPQPGKTQLSLSLTFKKRIRILINKHIFMRFS